MSHLCCVVFLWVCPANKSVEPAGYCIPAVLNLDFISQIFAVNCRGDELVLNANYMQIIICKGKKGKIFLEFSHAHSVSNVIYYPLE